jgi:diguanylate cyclase (GGDEF)-like protein
MAVVAVITSMMQKSQYRVEPGKFQFQSSDKLVTQLKRDDKAHYTTIENFDELQPNSDDGTVEFTGDDNGFVFVNKNKEQNSNPTNKNKFTVDFGASDDSSFTITRGAALQNMVNDSNAVSAVEKKDIGVVSEVVERKEDAPSDTQIAEEPTLSLFESEESDPIETKPQTIDEPQVEIVASIDISSYSNIASSKEATSAIASLTNQLEDSDNIANTADFSVALIAELEKKLENSSDELAYMLNHFLEIISYVLEADTIAFVWVNEERNTLLFDLSRSIRKDALKDDSKMVFGNDILSKIANTAKPEILSQISPAAELDLIPYYKRSVGVSSFIGIPIITQNKVVGILCADTNINNAYNSGHVAFLGLFTRIVSAFYCSFAGHYSRENANKTLVLLNHFMESTSERGATITNIFHSIIDFVVELYDCTSIGVVAYNNTARAWTVCSYKSVKNVDDQFFNAPITDSSFIRYCITRNTEIVFTKIPTDSIRINKYEPAFENGTFLSIPIKSLTDVYGALFIEAENNELFINDVDIDILKAICNQSGEALEKIELMALYNKYVHIETNTGIFTEKAFRERLNLEFLRAAEFKNHISLVLVGLDKYASLDEANKKFQMFDHIINFIGKQLKPFEIIGRVNSDVLGIILIERSDDQSKLLFERIRQQIATKNIMISNEEHFITISAGIASTKQNDTFDTFTSNATRALRHAQERTNCVHLFE